MAKTCKEWFEEADREFVEAVRRVMLASTGDPFQGGPACEWSRFRYEMARLQQFAEVRHAAKHAAEREAKMSTPPVTFQVASCDFTHDSKDCLTPRGCQGCR